MAEQYQEQLHDIEQIIQQEQVDFDAAFDAWSQTHPVQAVGLDQKALHNKYLQNLVG